VLRAGPDLRHDLRSAVGALLFGIILPLTFLGGTYYAWTTSHRSPWQGFTGSSSWCC
jgi:hypothetical protein